MELHLCSTRMPSWHGQEQFYLLLSSNMIMVIKSRKMGWYGDLTCEEGQIDRHLGGTGIRQEDIK